MTRGRQMGLSLLAAIALIGLGAFFVRARFVGEPPAHAGPHRVVHETLQVPGEASPYTLHVWRPETRDPAQRASLVLYAPAWGGTATDSSLLCADLASRGYVVVGFDDVKWDPGANAEEVAVRN